MNHSRLPAERPVIGRGFAVAAVLLALALVVTACEGGGTTNQVLLDHSGANPDSIYRHHNP